MYRGGPRLRHVTPPQQFSSSATSTQRLASVPPSEAAAAEPAAPADPPCGRDRHTVAVQGFAHSAPAREFGMKQRRRRQSVSAVIRGVAQGSHDGPESRDLASSQDSALEGLEWEAPRIDGLLEHAELVKGVDLVDKAV